MSPNRIVRGKNGPLGNDGGSWNLNRITPTNPGANPVDSGCADIVPTVIEGMRRDVAKGLVTIGAAALALADDTPPSPPPAPARLVRAQDAGSSFSGVAVQLAKSDDVDSLRRSAREAVQAKAEAVLVAGGDGTIGAMAGELAGSDCALGVLPAGTANVWARAMGLPRPAPLPGPGHTQMVPETPRTNVPLIPDGEIWDIETLGNRVYYVGSFTSARSVRVEAPWP